MLENIGSSPSWITQPGLKFYTNFYFSKFFGSRLLGLIHLTLLLSLFLYIFKKNAQNNFNLFKLVVIGLENTSIYWKSSVKISSNSGNSNIVNNGTGFVKIDTTNIVSANNDFKINFSNTTSAQDLRMGLAVTPNAAWMVSTDYDHITSGAKLNF